jgi:Uma2 family endonuclease
VTEHPFARVEPWTEEAYLGLGETLSRVELFDGGLLVSPPPVVRHQVICSELAFALHPAAERAGLDLLKTINLRLTSGRICNRDLVILAPVNYDYDQLVLDVAAVRLICEVASPDRPAVDRVLKMHYYAEAAIPWYLLVESEPDLVLCLFRFEDGHDVEHGVGRPGQALHMTEPVIVDLDPAVLLPRR